jgi:hypothetical protein
LDFHFSLLFFVTLTPLWHLSGLSVYCRCYPYVEFLPHISSASNLYRKYTIYYMFTMMWIG